MTPSEIKEWLGVAWMVIAILFTLGVGVVIIVTLFRDGN